MPSHGATASRSAALAALLLSTACGTLTTGQYGAMTAGLIGCPSDEVTISHQKNVIWAGDGIEWRAECRGRRFICSHSGTAQCKEELQPATGAAPSVAGPSEAPAQSRDEAPRS
jgi:hypothetical protein